MEGWGCGFEVSAVGVMWGGVGLWEWVGDGSTSKNRPSHYNYKSPKQFLLIGYLETSELKVSKKT